MEILLHREMEYGKIQNVLKNTLAHIQDLKNLQ